MWVRWCCRLGDRVEEVVEEVKMEVREEGELCGDEFEDWEEMEVEEEEWGKPSRSATDLNMDMVMCRGEKCKLWRDELGMERVWK